MKTRIYCILICFLLTATVLNGQDYLYSKSRKFYINKYDNFAVVQIPDKNEFEIKQTLAQKNTIHIEQVLRFERKFYLLKSPKGKSVYSELKQLDSINASCIIPTYFTANAYGDTSQFIMFDEFRVRFKHNVSKDEINELNSKWGGRNS